MAISKKQEEQAARSFGLKGPYTKENLENHKRSDPVFARKMAMVEDKLNMRKGGVVKLSEGGGRVGQFGGTVSPEYQRIQDEREANKAAVEKKDLGIDTDKGGLGEDNPAPLNILPDVPANDPPPVADDPATVVDDPPPADDPAPASVPTPGNINVPIAAPVAANNPPNLLAFFIEFTKPPDISPPNAPPIEFANLESVAPMPSVQSCAATISPTI